MGPPGEREWRRLASTWRMGVERKAPGELGGPRVGAVPTGGGAGPEIHKQAHTPVLLQFVVYFSGSDPETQTDRKEVQGGGPNSVAFLPPDPTPQMPQAVCSPDSPYKAAMGDIHPARRWLYLLEGTCMLIIHNPFNPPSCSCPPVRRQEGLLGLTEIANWPQPSPNPIQYSV